MPAQYEIPAAKSDSPDAQAGVPLRVLRQIRPQVNAVQLDDKVCFCFHVSKRKILNYIRVHEPRVASQISECGGAGTGCGWCVPLLKRFFEEARHGRADAADEPTFDECARQRGDYIRSGRGVPPPGATPPPPPDPSSTDQHGRSRQRE